MSADGDLKIGRRGAKAPRTATTVVHARRDEYDVYIGRGKCPRTGRNGSWGNPFKVSVLGSRETMRSFLAMLQDAAADPDWLAHAKAELQGKRLGCWCKPGLCHGDILARLVDGEPWDSILAWVGSEMQKLAPRERRA